MRARPGILPALLLGISIVTVSRDPPGLRNQRRHSEATGVAQHVISCRGPQNGPGISWRES